MPRKIKLKSKAANLEDDTEWEKGTGVLLIRPNLWAGCNGVVVGFNKEENKFVVTITHKNGEPCSRYDAFAAREEMENML